MGTLAIRQLANQTKANMDNVLLECDAIDATPPTIGTLPAIISAPKPNQVFQKSSASGNATFKVEWRGDANLVRIKNGTATVAESASGDFTLAAGWYDAVLVTNGVEGDLIKVGVGDVFLVAGQSNGVSPLQPYTFTAPVPAQGKVILSDYYRHGFYAFRDPAVEPLIADVANGVYVGGICWLYCGITLNRNYPVMFVNVAQGNTSTTDWVNNYILRVFDAWAIYKPKAILWFQGESDAVNGISQATSYANMDACISSLRQVTVTPWIIAKNSINGGYAPIRAAQQQVIDKWSHVYQGPDTDTVRNPAVNTDNEFFGTQLQSIGNLWANCITSLGF